MDGSVIDSSFNFEDAADLKYGWSGIDVCCNCGGGKSVYDDIAVSFINNDNFNTILTECTFKQENYGISGPFKSWNNFALYQLIGDIDNDNLNQNLIIFTESDDINANISYQIIFCEFSESDYANTNNSIYNDFWLFGSLQYYTESIYLINSEWFDIDEYVISSQVIIDNRSYSFCNALIENSTIDASIDLIVPCFEEDELPTMSPTNEPS